MGKLPNGRTPLPTAPPRTALTNPVPICGGYCDRPATEGFRSCLECRVSRYRRGRERLAQRKEKNLCRNCDAPPVPNRVCCAKHLEANRVWQAQRKQKQRQQSKNQDTKETAKEEEEEDEEIEDCIVVSAGSPTEAEADHPMVSHNNSDANQSNNSLSGGTPDHRANEIHDPEVLSAAMALMDLHYSTPR